LGRTFLHWACEAGRLEIVKLLMNREDLDINTQDFKGRTGFHSACQRGYIELVKLLISRDDLDTNTQDKMGRTAFHLACGGKYIEIVKLLISRDDLDLNKQDKYGRTAFHFVYEAGKFQEEEITWLGVQICARCELHPSELLGSCITNSANFEENEGNLSENALRRKEIELQISNGLSKRKSARK